MFNFKFVQLLLDKDSVSQNISVMLILIIDGMDSWLLTAILSPECIRRV